VDLHQCANPSCPRDGEPFRPKAPDRSTYCSRACSFAHKGARRAARAASTMKVIGHLLKQCRICGNEYRSNRKALDSVCKASACQSRWIWEKNERGRVRKCIECGVEYCKSMPSRGNDDKCSPACVQRYSRRMMKKVRRISKARRSARSRGAGMAEKIDPIKVFDQAGWQCTVCCRDTPRELRGTHHECAPELDHIYPVSRGGTHTKDNVRLLCRRCNALKSDGFDDEWLPAFYESIGISVEWRWFETPPGASELLQWARDRSRQQRTHGAKIGNSGVLP
jgi:hypothetical protein